AGGTGGTGPAGRAERRGDDRGRRPAGVHQRDVHVRVPDPGVPRPDRHLRPDVQGDGVAEPGRPRPGPGGRRPAGRRPGRRPGVQPAARRPGRRQGQHGLRRDPDDQRVHRVRLEAERDRHFPRNRRPGRRPAEVRRGGHHRQDQPARLRQRRAPVGQQQHRGDAEPVQHGPGPRRQLGRDGDGRLRQLRRARARDRDRTVDPQPGRVPEPGRRPPDVRPGADRRHLPAERQLPGRGRPAREVRPGRGRHARRDRRGQRPRPEHDRHPGPAGRRVHGRAVRGRPGRQADRVLRQQLRAGLLRDEQRDRGVPEHGRPDGRPVRAGGDRHPGPGRDGRPGRPPRVDLGREVPRPAGRTEPVRVRPDPVPEEPRPGRGVQRDRGVLRGHRPPRQAGRLQDPAAAVHRDGRAVQHRGRPAGQRGRDELAPVAERAARCVPGGDGREEPRRAGVPDQRQAAPDPAGDPERRQPRRDRPERGQQRPADPGHGQPARAARRDHPGRVLRRQLAVRDHLPRPPVGRGPTARVRVRLRAGDRLADRPDPGAGARDGRRRPARRGRAADPPAAGGGL
ncbi:MAG: Aspartyl-tRNA(Asn) amidotransferase subunit A @ Glutamyl-tRNA(Gln) amidotransferase subunit A, partial [uncultured Phycisphaerae bacterium]